MALFAKDLRSELRQPQYLLGVVFFQFCLLFLFFLFQDSELSPVWWANLFWVNLLIAAMSLVLKNFSSESSDHFIYYYQVTDPVTLYVAKGLYNLLLLSIASVINLIMFQLLFEPVDVDLIRFTGMIMAGVFGLSGALTLVAFISGFSQNASVLINILVIPIIIPILLLLIRSTSFSLVDDYTNYSGDLTLILGIDILILAMALGLFPYLWRR